MILLAVLSVVLNLVLFLLMMYFLKKSMTDELTGLANFRYLKLYSRSNKKNNLCVVILDINNFKKINNISIHKGDEVLKEFSKELKAVLYKEAILCRYRSGDEFALVFRNKNKTEIVAIMNFTKTYFNYYSFNCLANMKDYRISFCYGISKIELESDVDNFFTNAELELAAAKEKK